MKRNEENKLEYGLISENSYNRNMNTINTIEKYTISSKKIYEIQEGDLKELFSILVNINTSQSNLEKIYDEIHQALTMCKRNDLFVQRRCEFEDNSWIRKYRYFKCN